MKKMKEKGVETSETNILDNENFKKWFKNSKAVNADGTPMVLYHQTDDKNVESIKNLGFESGRGLAILGDNQVPNGYFFKPSDENIGLGESPAQIPVYLSLQNPLFVDNRRELMFKIADLDGNTYKIYHQNNLKNADFNNQFERLMEKLKNTSKTDERTLILKKSQELTKKWKEWTNATAKDIRERITNVLINANYDGVILKNDTGSFNRNVTSYIALYPEQIKSIYNNGNFNPNEKSIMKEKAIKLNEQVRRIKEIMNLDEALTDEVYHFTSFRALTNILKTNEFMTTAAVSAISDMNINRGKYFFFSTTRSKSTGYKRGNVKLVLDGRKLNQRYKGVPVDYWQLSKDRSSYSGKSEYMNALLSSENEDRIITNEPQIPNAISYIKEIHVYVDFYTKHTDVDKVKLGVVNEICQKNNIPLYFYRDGYDWRLQNKNALVDIDSVYKVIDDSQQNLDYQNRFSNYGYVAVLYAFNDQKNYDKVISMLDSKDVETFKKLYDNHVRKYLSKNAIYDYESDFIYQSHLNNMKRTPDPMLRDFLKLLSDDMRKNNIKGVSEYIKLKRDFSPVDTKKETHNINEGLLVEKLTEVDDDVDLLYDMIFKADVDEIQRTGKVTEFMFQRFETSSAILKSELCVAAHKISPVKIKANGNEYNYYNFDEHIIGLSVNKGAFELALEHGGDIKLAASYVPEPQRNNFIAEFGEVKLKGSIHHELAHWIDNTFHNKTVEKTKKNIVAKSEKGIMSPDINSHFIERQGQIHNIRQAYRKHSDIWDTLTFHDLMQLVPTIAIVYSRLRGGVKDKWIKLIKKRMYREGMLGKKMYN